MKEKIFSFAVCEYCKYNVPQENSKKIGSIEVEVISEDSCDVCLDEDKGICPIIKSMEMEN